MEKGRGIGKGGGVGLGGILIGKDYCVGSRGVGLIHKGERLKI